MGTVRGEPATGGALMELSPGRVKTLRRSERESREVSSCIGHAMRGTHVPPVIFIESMRCYGIISHLLPTFLQLPNHIFILFKGHEAHFLLARGLLIEPGIRNRLHRKV